MMRAPPPLEPAPLNVRSLPAVGVGVVRARCAVGGGVGGGVVVVPGGGSPAEAASKLRSSIATSCEVTLAVVIAKKLILPFPLSVTAIGSHALAPASPLP